MDQFTFSSVSFIQSTSSSNEKRSIINYVNEFKNIG